MVVFYFDHLKMSVPLAVHLPARGYYVDAANDGKLNGT